MVVFGRIISNLYSGFLHTTATEQFSQCQWTHQIQTSILKTELVSIFLSLTTSSSSLSVYKFLVAPDHNHWHLRTLGDTPLGIGSVSRRIRYLNRNNNRKPYIHRVGFEPTIPEDKWPYTHALGRAVTGIFPVFFILKRFLKAIQKRFPFSRNMNSINLLIRTDNVGY